MYGYSIDYKDFNNLNGTENEGGDG